jgi:hypothetical protein
VDDEIKEVMSSTMPVSLVSLWRPLSASLLVNKGYDSSTDELLCQTRVPIMDNTKKQAVVESHAAADPGNVHHRHTNYPKLTSMSLSLSWKGVGGFAKQIAAALVACDARQFLRCL